VLDYTNRETYPAELEATEHPVEDGSSVVDHVRELPAEVIVEGGINEGALEGQGSLTSSGEDRGREALAFLRGCIGQPLRLVTLRFGTLSNMILIGYPHEINNVREVPFTLRFRLLKVATQASVIIPPAAPKPSAQAGSPTAQDVGAQGTIDSARDPVKDAANKSWLLQLVGG
jgi:hypothetical protein